MLVLAFAFLVSPSQASTASWPANCPSKTLRVIVPYPAGGGTDTIGRVVAQALSKSLGVTAVVENKPGASGTLGNDFVAKAAPNGCTILMGIGGALMMSPSFYLKLPYDTVKDLAPVTQIAVAPNLFVVPSTSPYKSVSDFVEAAKATPGKLSLGHFGNGTFGHVHAEVLKRRAEIDVTIVPYKGTAPVTVDLMGAALAGGFVDVGSLASSLGSERIRILAITGDRRHPALPDVATLEELGMDGFMDNGWYAVLTTGGTPKSVIDRLSAEVRSIIHSPEFVARLKVMGMTPVGNTPEEFGRLMVEGMGRLSAFIKKANIKPD